MTCILRTYRTDGCEGCSRLCPHKLTLHGLDGKGGRSAVVGIPQDYRNVTLESTPVADTQTQVYKMLVPYVATFKRHLSGGDRTKSLYLWSQSPGTGKTTTAVALLNAWIANEYLYDIKSGEQPRQTTAYFLDINELQTDYNLAVMTNDDDKMARVAEVIQRTQTASFAVIDDIGVRGATEAFRSLVHSAINSRTVNGLPTVYTSNLPITAMRQVFDERLYDRINDQCAAIEFVGESHRGMRK